jgi:hypothetical protein
MPNERRRWTVTDVSRPGIDKQEERNDTEDDYTQTEATAPLAHFASVANRRGRKRHGVAAISEGPTLA